MVTKIFAVLLGCLMVSGCAPQQGTAQNASGAIGSNEQAAKQAKSDQQAEEHIYWTHHPAILILTGVALSPLLLVTFPFRQSRSQCAYDEAGETVSYDDDLPQPTMCQKFARHVRQELQWANKEQAEWERAAQRQREEAERGREAAEEQRRQLAEQRRRDALRRLLAESPVQSEGGLQSDLRIARGLTQGQFEALRDRANNVILTAKEKRALRSITVDQWHALSQLGALYQWLRERQAEEDQKEEARREAEDREQALKLQAVTAQAAMEQAIAASDLADIASLQTASMMTAIWWNQQCLRNSSLRLPCY